MVSAASYPPLQKTQGRGTHSLDTGSENRIERPGHPPQAVVEQGTGKEDDAGADGHPVQDAERTSDDRASEMARRQHGEGGLGDDREKDEAADPDDKREEHEET